MANLSEWMSEKLRNLGTRADTAAYVVGVLSDRDLTELVTAGSVVLAYTRNREFDQHRRLADGVLAAEVAFPGWLKESALCVDLARRSYATCWRMLRGKWMLYDELSDRLGVIIRETQVAISDGAFCSVGASDLSILARARRGS